MSKIVVFKDSLSSNTKIHPPVVKESTHPILCLKNIQSLANFSQAALDLVGIKYYKTIKMAKQPLYFINSQEYLIKSSNTNNKKNTLENLFNKVHAVASLFLIPILMTHDGLTSLNENPTSGPIQTICASIAPHALTTLMVLGLMKSVFKIKKLSAYTANTIQKKQSDLTQPQWWERKCTLALCEGAKFTFTIARLLTPTSHLQFVKNCYNFTLLAHSSLNAITHYKEEHIATIQKDLTPEQLLEILETLIKQAPTSHLDVKEPTDDLEIGAVTKT